ncbi:MAG: hypothetical protein A2Y69_14165 [Candidatus Aminicenantes bacterium RBG_13_59_9]|nr:MAG: hypothetical protein A2Y69_14165 [Candidatus Aminicenantes bacterium RBG_13_59_9]
MQKRTAFLLIIAGLAAAAIVPACSKRPSADQIKASMEISDVQTRWVSKLYQPWPPRLILVPVLSFRVKNLTAEPMYYVNFNGIFKEKGAQENAGDNFRAAIRDKPIQPGQASDVIELKSNFGIDGQSVDSIRKNPFWRPWVARLFVQWKGSAPVLLAEYDVSREIDFKEDAPVGQEKKDDKPAEKKEEIKFP